MSFSLDRDGVEVIERFASETQLSGLEASLPVVVGAGVRSIARTCQVASEFASSSAVERLMRARLGEGCRLVRSILFDKPPGKSWTLGMHRDLAIAVQQRVDVAGFGPWSTKQGVLHVQPPRTVLESMLTLRLHIDPSDEENGCLQVIPGSHVCDEDRGFALSDAAPVVVERGGAVLMRPLLLHGSGPNCSGRRRRVLHLEFASVDLPGGLQWAESQPAAASP